jgi:hypothetical protein
MPETCAAIVIAAKHGELIKVRDYSGITDTVGALRCKFEFRTSDWDNATMTAVFCKGNMATNPEIVDDAIGVLLDSIDECAVPAEVLTRDAKYFSVGVWGVTTAGFRIVSKWLVFRIEDGCYVDATDPIEPTPTLFEQIMATLASKAPIEHEHNDIYYTKTEINNMAITGNPGASGGVVVETDPTVPSWAKQPNKPKYTASEVGALPNTTKIPSVTSDLTNNSGFITKEETYSQAEIDSKISLIPKFTISVVTKLPTTNISATTVYLLKDTTTNGNLYTEYIYVNGVWEILGGQSVDLSNYRKLDVAVPSEDVSYTNNELADKSGTIKGALDEAIDFVVNTAAPSLHTHNNTSVLNNLAESNGKLTYNGEDIGSSGREYIAGDLIEIKDGVIRSTLGDLIEGENSEEINEVFSLDGLSEMEVLWDNPKIYTYVFDEEVTLPSLPDPSKIFIIEFTNSEGFKKTFEVELEAEVWDFGANYIAILNCEEVEIGKELLPFKIDENSDAIYLFVDCAWGEEPYTYINLTTFEDYTGFSLKMGNKGSEDNKNYVKLPDEALNIDSTPTENSTNLVTSTGIYKAIKNATQKVTDEIGNKFQNLTAEDVGALPEDTFIPTKMSELDNDRHFTTWDDINGELLERSFATKDWVNERLTNKQDKLIIVEEPIENSDHIITSGGVYAALQNVGGSYELTEEDINTIKDAVLAAIPSAEEVIFGE